MKQEYKHLKYFFSRQGWKVSNHGQWITPLIAIFFIAFALWMFALTIDVPKYNAALIVNSNFYEQKLFGGFYYLVGGTPYTSSADTISVSNIHITKQAIAATTLTLLFYTLLLINTLIGQFKAKKIVVIPWIIMLCATILLVSELTVGFGYKLDNQQFDLLRRNPFVLNDQISVFYKIAFLKDLKYANTNLTQFAKPLIGLYAFVNILSALAYFVLVFINIPNAIIQQRVW
ncbi:hypothetical protein UUR10_0202 [Ureaplasma urealyticum serovar 10 str. ATCC 33699]|uniref:Uncharacterized protein n=1 Tax=Ureaplasma urealyticum serovar 10 (strain ATCC 33699 / Western) TaxID=565575 RepID=B5ZB17_UREU1|nr:hypothetical protein [Ureaplasma urealyticum]ACI60067.1 hypothetical protein UUR10_0202 [Ureaplasma urealyticum serovar 10 str. ATCC 33699]